MFKKITSVKRLTINEDEFLEYEIRVLKKKLILAIQDADNNLLDDNVLYVSRQLDKLILRFINTKNIEFE